MDKKKNAILMMIMSSFGFAVMGMLVKIVPNIPTVQKALFRTVAVILVSFLILFKNSKGIPKIVNYKILLVRCIFGTIGMVLNYYALSHLFLADANIIFRLSSIFALIFSFIFLKEKLDRSHIIPILIAFFGLFFIIRPSFNSSIFDYLISLVGAISASIAYTSLRVLGRTENSNMVVFCFALFNVVVLLPIVIFNYTPMSVKEVIILLLAGVFATLGQYGVTLAYKYAPSKEVSIYNYTGLIFSGMLELVFFGVLPDYISIIGYIIIFSASFMLYKLAVKNL
ncbi:MAG: EamA family transporter [Clostridiales bacterium]|nr:MAG: EamA family transporter [Clostridiales bacterium]